MNIQTPRPLAAIVILAMSLGSLATACTFDFDEFETPADQPHDVGVDAEEPDDVAPGDTDPDPDADAHTGEDADADPEPDVRDEDEKPLGASCEEADECAGDVCRGSVCLSECEDNDDCPAGADCFQLGTEQLCAPRCRDLGDCEHLDVNDELSCTYVVETREFGASPHRLSRACLTDSADDGVFDGIDNCPDDPNATQADSTGDGIGDACADTPYCHADADDGVLDYGETDFRPGSFAIPAAVDGRWLPVVGTTDADGTPDSTFALLDRETGEWQDKPSLEFPGTNRYVVSTNTGGFAISPGHQADADTDGEWTRLSPTGEVAYGPDYQPPEIAVIGTFTQDAYEPIPAAPLQFSNGAVEHLLWDSDDETTSLSQLATVKRGPGLKITHEVRQFENLRSGFDIPDGSDDSVQTLRHPDGTAGFAIWDSDQSTLHLADATAPPGAPEYDLETHALTIPDQWHEGPDESTADGCSLDDDCEDGEVCDDAEGICLDENVGCVDADDCEEDQICHADVCTDEDDVEDLSDFEPVAVTAPGGQLYVFDRQTGRAGRFLAERHEDAKSDASALFAREWGNFERIEQYDRPEFQDFDEPRVYLLPDARGFGLVGAPTYDAEDDDPPGTVEARELYFDCLDATDDFDTGGDGIGEFVDNCPGHDNPEQQDLDDDSWGDVCDPDTDGDGIPDQLDVIEADNGNDDGDDNNDNGDNDDGTVPAHLDTDNDGVHNDDDDDIDGDGILTRYDPFPFDSSNDGTPNRWTDDASGNGILDQQLRDAGLDANDFLSLPVEHDFVYLVDGDPNALYHASLDAPQEATEIDVGDRDPHRPSAGENRVYFLDGPPGETNEYAGYDLEAETVDYEVTMTETGDDIDLAIRSVTPIDEEPVQWLDTGDNAQLVVHEQLENDGWAISELKEATVAYDRPSEWLIPVNEAFDHFWYAQLQVVDGEEVVFFVAAESDCQECASPYLFWVDDEQIELLDGLGVGFDLFDGYGGRVLFESPPSWFSSNWYIHHLDIGADPMIDSIEVAPRFDALHGLSEARYDQGFESENGPVFGYTASRWGQTSDLWMYVPTAPNSRDRWQLLVADEEPIVDVAWRP